MSSIVDEAFAAVPRDEWAGGDLWREPDDLESAHYLRHAGAEPERQRSTRAATERRRKEVAVLRAVGWTITQIAASFGVREDAIRSDIAAMRIEAGTHGVASAEWAAQRAAINAALDDGLSIRATARKLGVHPSSVCRALAARKKEAPPCTA